MPLTISGKLITPIGLPAANAEIRFIAVAATDNDSGEVIPNAESIVRCAADGTYSITLEYCRYQLATKISTIDFMVHGRVTIDKDTVASDLEDLIAMITLDTALSDSLIAEFEKLKSEAELAALNAEHQVDLAKQQVTLAEDQVDLAKAEVVNASNQADRAKDEADRASQITGLDTVEEAVELALSEFAGVMTVSERDAILAQNEEKYAASGFVNYGKSRTETEVQHHINEGMYTIESEPNLIYMGRGSSNPVGASKTDFPVTHIAGCVSKLVGINYSSSQYHTAQIMLPPAPDGTVIYDSSGDCRGTGKANLNLATEVDPKYGDAPTGTEVEIKNEGVARAFEGSVKNGDFRFGKSLWIEALGASYTVSNSVATVTSASSISRIEQNLADDYRVAGIEFTVTLKNPASNSASAAIKIGGTGDSIEVPPSDNVVTISLTSSSANDGFYRVFPSITDVIQSIEVHSVSIRKATEEVVTDRVDLPALEQFDMVVKDDEVFDMIQSQSTTFGNTDVPTVESVKSDDFFAAYEGQQNIAKGRCVKWSTLSDVQKRKVAGYLKERLAINDDGELENISIVQDSKRGLGNGDWFNVNSANGALEFKSGMPVLSRNGHPFVKDGKRQGVFTDNNGSYYYVLGTVSRLNQGGSHPLNETGSTKFFETKPDGTTWGSYVWSDAKVTLEPKCKADCFRYAEGQDYPMGGKSMVNSTQGKIGAGSGRDDGRFYDGIYEGGLGGVIDRRLGAAANDSHEESSKVLAKVFNGTYRGMEKLVWTSVSLQYLPTSTNSTVRVEQGKYAPTVGTTIYSVTTAGIVTPAVVIGLAVADSNWDIQLDKAVSREINGYVVYQSELNLSVSGKFPVKEVLGDPANILQIDALKNGWLGAWNPTIPSDSSATYTYSRKVLDGTRNRYTADNGATWFESGSWNASFDETTNSISRSGGVDDGRVYIVNYTAWAKMTKESANKKVLNATSGLLGIVTTQNHSKSTFAESVAGLILKSDASGITTEQSSAVKFLIEDIVSRIKTLTTDMVAPTNSSQAIKVAVYQISENGQCKLGFIANTMSHNGTDWGELEAVQIPSGSSGTFTDTNGTQQLSMITETALAHGWTHNHARAGVQVPGVDL